MSSLQNMINWQLCQSFIEINKTLNKIITGSSKKLNSEHLWNQSVFRKYYANHILCSAASKIFAQRWQISQLLGLWQNAEKNQPLIGCLIISLTHSLLIETRAILIIQEAKYKLVY